MILTKEFLYQQKACVNGIFEAEEKHYIGMDYDDVIRNLITDGKRDFAGWMIEQKSTEQYVRANGGQITMGAYQVFSPLTGQHTRYETEAEAKAALIEVAKEVLAQHCPRVVQELSNENGDTTWIPTNMNETLEIK